MRNNLWDYVPLVGIGVVFGLAIILGVSDWMDANAAEARRVDRARIELEFCKQRGGYPKFDLNNYVIGCEEHPR